MSPILVRPVREQLEHDRVIRLLQAKYKRKFEVAINLGTEQTAPVGTGTSAWYPDLVLQSTERGRKLMGTVEVETAESVNNLEAMSQWVPFSRLRVPFHLYVPASAIDPTRRLCQSLQVPVAELWAYHALGEQLRFTLVQRAQGAGDGKAARPAAARPAASRARTTGRAASTGRTTTAASRTAAAGRKATATRTAPARPARRAAAATTATRRKTASASIKKSSASRGASTKKASRPSRAQKRK